jgi:hypothetical protein
MPFEQLHIFLKINLCSQAPDIELKAMDCVFPCCTAEFYSTLKVGPEICTHVLRFIESCQAQVVTRHSSYSLRITCTESDATKIDWPKV